MGCLFHANFRGTRRVWLLVWLSVWLALTICMSAIRPMWFDADRQMLLSLPFDKIDQTVLQHVSIVNEGDAAKKTATTTTVTTSSWSYKCSKHAQALDGHGSPCYVASTTPQPLQWQTAINCSSYENVNTVEGNGGRQVLDKVRKGLLESRDFLAATDTATTSNSDVVAVPRILCMVYTVDLPNSRRNIDAILQTWAPHCDGFLAFSNVTIPERNTVNVLHQGPESYNNMWQKVRSMWFYVHDHYLEDFDYFHIGGDDVYLVVDNLRTYLMGDQIQDLLVNGTMDVLATYQADQLNIHDKVMRWKTERPRPLFLGFPLAFRKCLFPHGGPGYTLNRAALKILVQEGLPTVLANLTDSREDVFIAEALRYSGVTVSDTRDALGGWRYQLNHAQLMFDFHFSPLKDVAPNLHLGGLEGISSQTVSFHMRFHKGGNVDSDKAIRKYYNVLESMCEKDAKDGKLLI